MYLLTIIPSVLGIPFIWLFKTLTNLLLFLDMILKLCGLGFYPSNQAYIWNIDNWWKYSFRRWIIDFLLTPVHGFTQIIPIANWLLNILPIFGYWVNAMVL